MIDAMVNDLSDTLPIETFYTFVRPLVGAEVPDALLSHTVQEAAVWFAQESRVLVDTIVVRLQRHVRDYALRIPPHQFLLGPDLRRRDDSHFRYDWGNYFFGASFTHNRGRAQINRDGPFPVLVFTDEPDAPGEREFRYQYAPRRDHAVLPREIYEQWMEPVKYKAACEIMRVPGEAWGNAKRALEYELLAQRGMTNARRRVAMDYQSRDPKIRGREFVRPAFGAGFWGGW